MKELVFLVVVSISSFAFANESRIETSKKIINIVTNAVVADDNSQLVSVNYLLGEGIVVVRCLDSHNKCFKQAFSIRFGVDKEPYLPDYTPTAKIPCDD